MRPFHCLATAVALSSSLAAAWPDSLDNVYAVKDIGGLLFRRQDGSGGSATGTTARATGTASATGDASNAPSATGTASGSGSGKTTAKATLSGTKTSGGGSKASGNATNTDDGGDSTEFDPRLPAGGIQMVTPAPISGAQYYKVGDFVTFAWNYTSLSVTPSAIDILATCTANQATYTLAVNQTVDPTGQVIWDTGNYQSTATVPLLTETYTLLIYDAESSVSATARSGYLAPYKQFYFGMYLPQPYTSFANFKCPTCVGSGALSVFERQTLGVMLGVTTVTVLSFTWFAGGMFGFF